MKRLTRIFQALLGVAALILTTLVAAGRLAWRTIKIYLKYRYTTATTGICSAPTEMR